MKAKVKGCTKEEKMEVEERLKKSIGTADSAAIQLTRLKQLIRLILRYPGPECLGC